MALIRPLASGDPAIGGGPLGLPLPRDAASRAVRSAGTALLLVGSALLCGLRLPAAGERTLAFEAFGFVEGVLSLVVVGLFLHQRVIAPPLAWTDRLTLAYWFGATAVLLRLALPPPGVGYWIGTGILAAGLLGASGGGDRRRTLVTLGVAVALCGMLRFALVPFVWRHASLPDLGPIELGGVSEWAKGLVTDYQPVRPFNEIVNALGLCLFGLAIRRAWPQSPVPALEGLSTEERDRLLLALLVHGGAVEALPATRSRPVLPSAAPPPGADEAGWPPGPPPS